MKYDVFISSKSTDYEIAEEVCNYLKKKGLSVFFSKRSIDEEGDSRYEKVIADALRDSANMIVVCSDANHVRDDRGAKGSKWVYYEWSTFHQMILDNEKPEGTDIVTIYTSDADLRDLPRRLRSRQCIPFGEYKNRIMRYMDDNLKIHNNTDDEPEQVAFSMVEDDSKTPTPSWKKLLIPLLTGLIGLLLGLGVFQMCKPHSTPLGLGNANHKTLVLAGGGSVVTFLDDKYRGILNKDTLVNTFSDNKYPNAIYLHMPSGVALTLLAEEAIMPYSRVNQPFYPVCFSAEKAVEEQFTEKCTRDQLLAAGHIVEYKLGDEKLAVYVEKDAPHLSTIVDSSATEITVGQLARLLRSGGSTIFSTSTGSGTYHAYYKELIKKGFDIEKVHCENFSNQSSLALLQAPNGAQKITPYIIMGGDIYRPEELKEQINKGIVRKLMLIDDEGESITRPLYIYFLAYSKMDERKVERFIVPDEVLKLLYDLDFKNSKQLIDDKNQLIIEDTKQIIVPIE